MLVLSRRKGQSIKIGDDVVVTVCSVERGKVKVGITAPGEIEIDREEVRDKKGRSRSQETTNNN